MIKAEALSYRLGSKEIIKPLDLEIAPGEFVTLLGPNGAGKSTLLKLLALVLKPSGGKLYINGQLCGENNRLRKNIGVISHQSFLYENLTPMENLEFYGRMYEVENLKRRCEEVLEAVGLEYVFNDPVRTFSRGMQQRLAIARAILHEPTLLLLDEPYTGLDQQAIAILNRVIAQWVEKKGTIFLVTHNYEKALELSHRVLILVRGKLVYQAAASGLTAEGFKKLYSEHVGGKP